MEQKENEKVEETTNEEKKVVENEKNDYNENKVEEEKSLEQQVKEIKDQKYLATQIVETKEELSSLRKDINTILGILKQNSNSFTDSETKSTNDNNDKQKSYILNI